MDCQDRLILYSLICHYGGISSCRIGVDLDPAFHLLILVLIKESSIGFIFADKLSHGGDFD